MAHTLDPVELHDLWCLIDDLEAEADCSEFNPHERTLSRLYEEARSGTRNRHVPWFIPLSWVK